MFRLEVGGQENLAPSEAPNIIAVDHVSRLDAPILFSLLLLPFMMKNMITEPVTGEPVTGDAPAAPDDSAPGA